MKVPKFQIATEILCSYVKNKKFFKLESLEKEILKQGGLLRVDSYNPIKGALENLVDMGMLKYNLEKGTYSRAKEAQSFYQNIKRR